MKKLFAFFANQNEAVSVPMIALPLLLVCSFAKAANPSDVVVTKEPTKIVQATQNKKDFRLS